MSPNCSIRLKATGWIKKITVPQRVVPAPETPDVSQMAAIWGFQKRLHCTSRIRSNSRGESRRVDRTSPVLWNQVRIRSGDKMRQDTEAALKQFDVNTFARGGIINKLEERLSPDETVIYIAPTNVKVTKTATGKTEMLPGAIALTSRRIIFTYKVLLDHKTISVDLAQVHSVNSRGDSITGGHIEVLTMVNTMEFLVK